jgi:hypothetical protein
MSSGSSILVPCAVWVAIHFLSLLLGTASGAFGVSREEEAVPAGRRKGSMPDGDA